MGEEALSFPLTLNFLSIMGNEFNEVGILALFYLDFENAGFYRKYPPLITFKISCVINIIVSFLKLTLTKRNV